MKNNVMLRFGLIVDRRSFWGYWGGPRWLEEVIVFKFSIPFEVV